MLAATILAASSLFTPAAGSLPIEPPMTAPAIVQHVHSPVPAPDSGRRPTPRAIAVIKRGAPVNERRQAGPGFTFYLTLDAGRIAMSIDHDEDEAYIDAEFPYDGNAMGLALATAQQFGYTPIDEEECPPELRDDNVVRVYMEYI